MKVDRIELKIGISALGLDISEENINKLIAYINLLYKWNKVYSLTAVIKSEEVLTHHLLDGLTVIPHIKNEKSVIDVGSGMGVPSVIIAICCPEIQVVALDSNRKKSVFLKQVAIELGLNNLLVINQRVENYVPDMKFSVIISRAFASIDLFVKLTIQLKDQAGYWLAMKGRMVMETYELGSDYQVKFLEVRIPGTQLERKLVKIETAFSGVK